MLLILITKNITWEKKQQQPNKPNKRQYSLHRVSWKSLIIIRDNYMGDFIVSVRVPHEPPSILWPITNNFIYYAFYYVFKLKIPKIKIKLFPVQTHWGGAYGTLSIVSLSAVREWAPL